MTYAIRILLVVVVVELLVGSSLLARRAWRAVPLVPDEELNDPLIMPEMRAFARRADRGQALEWTQLGEALLGKGFYAHAEHAFREALRQQPESIPAQFGLAFALDRMGRMQESSEAYRLVLTLPAASDEQEITKHYALYAMGRNALRLEQANEAEELFGRDVNFAPSAFQYAKLLIRSGRAEEALPIIETVLKDVGLSLEFYFLQQRAYEALGREREAFLAAAMVERSAYLVSMNFNTTYVTPMDQLTGGSRLLRELADVSGDDDLIYYEDDLLKIREQLGDKPIFAANAVDEQLLRIAVQRQQPERVQKLTQQFRERGEVNAMILDAEGDALQMLGQLTEAAELWERAVSLTPGRVLHRKLIDYYGAREPERRDWHRARHAWINGLVEYRSNRLQQALKPFREATEIASDFAAPWFYIGDMHFHLEQPDRAIPAYERCLEIQPGHGRAAAKLAFLQSTPEPDPTEEPTENSP